LKKILIIEDEEPLAQALKYTLGREGYDVDIAADGAVGLEKFDRSPVDLVLLDLMLPEVDGLEVCRRIRARSAVPILMLTAKDSDIDEVLGLELGADDYITKPFNMHNLIARMKAVLRRAEGDRGVEPRHLEWGRLEMDLERHEVVLDGEAVHLTPTEYRILELFMLHPQKALTREQLVNRVWEDGFYGSPKTLDVHIRHLREKIESDPARPDYIRTVRGTGYKLDRPPGDEG
jgi:two-component system, OmpR family, response regulator RegX3